MSRFISAQFPTVAPSPVEGSLPSFDGAVGWLNSLPLALSDLRGNVVLIDFWTYTCINWQRQLPYVRAWAAKYKERGLVVIGVHTPEFSFERKLENVRQAAKQMSIEYPVAIDSDYVIWRAFKNQYWPALYFVDAQGLILHHVFREGEYAQSERIIQELLAAARRGGSHDLVSVAGRGPEAAADWSNLNSPENYVGYERTEHFGSPGGIVRDHPHIYSVPSGMSLNQWALSGNWTMQREAAVLNQPVGRMVYRFHARDLHLVMGPQRPENPVRFRVFIDGRPAGAAHGTDVDNQGNGTVREPRMYQLIRQRSTIADRQFEIKFLDPGIEAFCFTFG